MAATHPRRRKSEIRAESSTYDAIPILEVFVNAELTVRQLLYKILSNRGPYTSAELVEVCRKYGRVTTSIDSVRKEIRELKRLGLVIKANGGYAIHNWMDIGA